MATDIKNYNQFVSIKSINNHDQFSSIRTISKLLAIMATLSAIQSYNQYDGTYKIIIKMSPLMSIKRHNEYGSHHHVKEPQSDAGGRNKNFKLIHFDIGNVFFTDIRVFLHLVYSLSRLWKDPGFGTQEKLCKFR